MPIDLSDPASGTSLTLFGANSYNGSQNAEVDVSPPPGFKGDEAFLVSLEQEETITLQGAITAPRLTRTAGYSTDPETALAEWLVTFEAFVNGGQGDGYELTRTYRTGETYNGYITDAEWSIRGGEGYEAGWTLEFIRGQGFGVDNGVSPDSVGSVGGNIGIDGTIAPTFTEFQMSKQQEVSSARRLLADSPDDNDLTSDAGVTRTITITGQIEGTATERATFESDITDTLGQDTRVGLVEPFTGRTFTGMLQAYEPTDEAGTTRLGEFGLTFIEGTN